MGSHQSRPSKAGDVTPGVQCEIERRISSWMIVISCIVYCIVTFPLQEARCQQWTGTSQKESLLANPELAKPRVWIGAREIKETIFQKLKGKKTKHENKENKSSLAFNLENLTAVIRMSLSEMIQGWRWSREEFSPWADCHESVITSTCSQ